MMIYYLIVYILIFLVGNEALKLGDTYIRWLRIPSVTVALALSSGFPSESYAKSVIYERPDNGFSFVHSDDLVVSPKLVKTHDIEIFLKSQSVKNYNAGLTVDRVKVKSVRDFGTVEQLAQRVINVEKAKEGVFEADVVSQSEATVSAAEGFPVYDLEYKIESSRGRKHFLVKSTIVDNKLYVFTVQMAEDGFGALEKDAHAILNSFKIQPG
jgi:hypothetical protein